VTVGICTIEMFIPHAQSLKDKRQVVRSLLDRVRGRHNVSVAEVAHQELWQRAGIAIAAVGSSQRPLGAMFDGILREIEENVPGQIVRHEIEYV
jgi:uncharacterized protein YlxP (DUF503 family)